MSQSLAVSLIPYITQLSASMYEQCDRVNRIKFKMQTMFCLISMYNI